MAKKKKGKQKKNRQEQNILPIAIAIVFILLMAYLYRDMGFVSEENKIGDPGIVEVDSPDGKITFEYVSVEEARRLLDEARSRGEFKFLFPQIDLNGIDYINIENTKVTASDGSEIVLLGLSKLTRATEISSNIDGTIRASQIYYEEGVLENTPLTIFTTEAEDYVAELYVPIAPLLNSETSREFRGGSEVSLGDEITLIPEEVGLKKEIFPDDWQVALIIKTITGDEEGEINGSSLENILTRNGNIIMVK